MIDYLLNTLRTEDLSAKRHPDTIDALEFIANASDSLESALSLIFAIKNAKVNIVDVDQACLVLSLESKVI